MLKFPFWQIYCFLFRVTDKKGVIQIGKPHIIHMDRETIIRYFDARTTPDEDRMIMEWAMESEENRKILEKERLVWTALLLNAGGGNLNHETSVRQKISGIWRAVACAAAVFIIGLIGYVFGKPQRLEQIVKVPAGQRVELQLADGTKVWLNSGSTLVYPNDFGRKSRVVSLVGEGYFEVSRDDKREFLVSTSDYDVRVLGTVFNVSSYPSAPFETTLLKGSVKVSSKDGMQSVILKPDQCATSGADGNLAVSDIPNRDRFSWIDGILTLNNVTFAEMMDEFSNYYGVNIVIERPSLSDVRCTGKFRKEDGVEYSLKVLTGLVHFDYEFDSVGRRIIIR